MPAEAEAAPEKKRPHRLRVPTSLVVTLVGIALTAWLLPAFTRQWDDRQKAQELRGATIQTLNSEFVRMYVASRRVFRTTSASRALFQDQAVLFALLDQWQLAWIPIQAQVRTYFPELRADFSAFGRVVAALAFFASSYGPEARQDVKQMRHDYSLKVSSKEMRQIEADVSASGDTVLAQLKRESGFESVARLILDKMDVLDAKVLDAHVRGYSTTSSDLLHDLIP